MPVAVERPTPSEFHSYYAAYVERVGDGPILDILREQGREAARFLRTIPEDRRTHRYAPGKWSVNEVLGHLVDSERVFVFRALSFGRGETQELPGFDQDAYVPEGRFDDRSLAAMIQDVEATRAATVALFDGLPAEAWTRSGVANGSRMSVRALAYVLAGHETHHLGVLRERYLS